LPIIALTAHAMKGEGDRTFAAGMDSYITKPISARELLDRIEELRGQGVVGRQNIGPSKHRPSERRSSKLPEQP